jgi:hypothetical protein
MLTSGRRTWMIAGAALAIGSCGSPIASDVAPPFVVVVPRVSAVPGASLPPTLWYRLRKLSAPRDLERTVTAGPRDTVRFGRLDVATYELTTGGWPSRCRITEEGDRQQVIVFEENTSSIVRIRILCEPSLQVSASIEGQPPTDSVVLRLIGPDGRTQLRRVRMTEPQIIDGLPAGTYRFGYTLLPPNCRSLAPGGAATIPVEVGDGGGAVAVMRFQCAPANGVPRVVSFGATYADGIIGLAVRAVDGERKLDRIGFGVTDCTGRWVGQTSERVRNGFLGPAGISEDTAQATIAMVSPIPADAVDRHCVAVRVIDRDGNSSPVWERPLTAAAPARAPVITSADAVFLSRFELGMRLEGSDPDGDFAGVHALITFRDGTLNGRFDGEPDVASMNSIGYPGWTFPPLPVGNGRPDVEAYVEVAMVAIDRAGNLAVARDRRLFP